jgi:DNA-binding transcriptional LysR family regulator
MTDDKSECVRMNFRHLRTFVAIVDHGGFARAATRVNLTQSAASRQIHALEAELGVALFDRIGRRVKLTSEGEDLLRQSRRVLAEIASLGERARALKTGHTGVLRLGTTPQVIETLLADFLVGYRRRHPGVEVHLFEDGGARLPNRLERGDVHLTIMPAGDERFEERLLYPMYVLAVLPKSHRLSRHRILELSELADEPLLLLDRGFASWEWFHAACQVAHIKPRILVESAAPHTVVALARTGHGIAVVPSPVRIPSEGVRTVPLVYRGLSIGRWAVVAWDPQRFMAAYAKQFVDELVAVVQRAYPGRELTRRAPPLPRPKERVS